jgi:hypothetical protein
MSWQRWVLAAVVVVVAAAQYGLVVYALRDLAKRPRVRGDNKVLWALVILTLPFAGAVLYAAVGPTSFLPRDDGATPTAVAQWWRRRPRRRR